MESLIQKFRRKISATDTAFIRSLEEKINWNSRLIGIKGQRGVGKTTLLLQHIKLNFSQNLEEVLYVSLDDLWFTENKLVNLAEDFEKKGGKFLFLDEVHKYPEWSQTLKNLYDDHPELKIIFTGSSMLEILNARADISRRAVIYKLSGLSFREFLKYEHQIDFENFTLENIIDNHIIISQQIASKIKPLKEFDNYLKYGYYPFYKEEKELYYSKLQEVVNFILEVEIPQLKNVSLAFLPKIKHLLFAISESAPFVPNISKLSERIGITRETLLNYLLYLSDANLINNVYKQAKGISRLQKPDKIFLENTNLMHALGNANIGNIRETFFVNQLSHANLVEYSNEGDFLVNGNCTFEIGGKQKNNKQIAGIKNAYIAADNIEFGYENKIPLWLFGFLY